MIEEYGSLSEEELLQEISQHLEENKEIDASGLELRFEADKLKITGALSTEEELEILITVLEDYVDPKDYLCEVEILEGVDTDLHRQKEDEEEDEEEVYDEGVHELGEDELAFEEDEADDDEEEEDDNNKW